MLFHIKGIKLIDQYWNTIIRVSNNKLLPQRVEYHNAITSSKQKTSVNTQRRFGLIALYLVSPHLLTVIIHFTPQQTKCDFRGTICLLMQHVFCFLNL